MQNAPGTHALPLQNYVHCISVMLMGFRLFYNGQVIRCETQQMQKVLEAEAHAGRSTVQFC